MVLGALWSVLPGNGAVTLAAVALNLIFLVAGGVLLALARSGAFRPGSAIGLAGLACLSPNLHVNATSFAPR
jgi:hypothetical protein